MTQKPIFSCTTSSRRTRNTTSEFVYTHFGGALQVVHDPGLGGSWFGQAPACQHQTSKWKAPHHGTATLPSRSKWELSLSGNNFGYWGLSWCWCGVGVFSNFNISCNGINKKQTPISGLLAVQWAANPHCHPETESPGAAVSVTPVWGQHQRGHKPWQWDTTGTTGWSCGAASAASSPINSMPCILGPFTAAGTLQHWDALCDRDTHGHLLKATLLPALSTPGGEDTMVKAAQSYFIPDQMTLNQWAVPDASECTQACT